MVIKYLGKNLCTIASHRRHMVLRSLRRTSKHKLNSAQAIYVHVKFTSHLNSYLRGRFQIEGLIPSLCAI